MRRRAEARLRYRNRHGRAIVVCAAVLLTLGLCVGYANASSSSGSVDQQKLAAQDKVVARANRLQALDARLVVARRSVARVRKATARASRHVTRAARPARVVPAFVMSPDNPCASVGARGGTKLQRAARRTRELRRKQALYNLNLSCPAV